MRVWKYRDAAAQACDDFLPSAADLGDLDLLTAIAVNGSHHRFFFPGPAQGPGGDLPTSLIFKFWVKILTASCR